MTAEKPISRDNKRDLLWILGGISLVLFAYTAIRSSTVCFTIDEAFTFQRYVKNASFFPAEYDMHTANYHMLNTWLMIICSKIFGIAEWSLRLPNVLAHAVYLFFTAKFAMRSRQTWNITAVFVLLNLHPYMLDFFSVARGYGLSFGFLAGSLWYTGEYFRSGKQLKHLALLMLFAGLAMWANFVMLTVFLAIALIVFIATVFSKEISFGKKLTAVGIGCGIAALFGGVAYPVLSGLQGAKAFFWNNPDLWEETVCVLAAKLAYPVNGDIYHAPHAADAGMIGVMSLFALFIGFALYRNRNSSHRTELLVLLTILILVMAEVIVQHLILDAPYPSGRTALFLFVIVIWMFAAALRDTMLPKLLVKITCAMLVSLQVFLACISFNFVRTSEWAYCADVRNAVGEVVSEADKNPKSFGGIALGCDPEFGNIIPYYLQLSQTRFITLYAFSAQEDPCTDFYIVSPHVTHVLSPTDTLRRYEKSELLILQNKSMGKMKVVAAPETADSSKWILKDESSNGELFSHTYTGADTAPARIALQMHVEFTEPKTQCVVRFWHWRNDALIWCGYYFIDAWSTGLTGVYTVNRNLPVKIAPGDKISLNISPYQPPAGPIEISQVKAHLQVAE
jgi:hypothetical protein